MFSFETRCVCNIPKHKDFLLIWFHSNQIVRSYKDWRACRKWSGNGQLVSNLENSLKMLLIEKAKKREGG